MHGHGTDDGCTFANYKKGPSLACTVVAVATVRVQAPGVAVEVTVARAIPMFNYSIYFIIYLFHNIVIFRFFSRSNLLTLTIVGKKYK
jgi:hypothetical protein